MKIRMNKKARRALKQAGAELRVEAVRIVDQMEGSGVFSTPYFEHLVGQEYAKLEEKFILNLQGTDGQEATKSKEVAS